MVGTIRPLHSVLPWTSCGNGARALPGNGTGPLPRRLGHRPAPRPRLLRRPSRVARPVRRRCPRRRGRGRAGDVLVMSVLGFRALPAASASGASPRHAAARCPDPTAGMPSLTAPRTHSRTDTADAPASGGSTPPGRPKGRLLPAPPPPLQRRGRPHRLVAAPDRCRRPRAHRRHSQGAVRRCYRARGGADLRSPPSLRLLAAPLLPAPDPSSAGCPASRSRAAGPASARDPRFAATPSPRRAAMSNRPHRRPQSAIRRERRDDAASHPRPRSTPRPFTSCGAREHQPPNLGGVHG